MSRFCPCQAPLPPLGPLGGRPVRRCPRCARLAEAARARRRRRARELRRPESLSPAGWASLHLTDELAAVIARDGLVLPESELRRNADEEDDA